MRVSLGILTLVIAVAALTGCGSSASDQAATMAPGADKVKTIPPHVHKNLPGGMTMSGAGSAAPASK